MPSRIQNSGNASGGSWAGAILLTLSNFQPMLAFEDRSTGSANAGISFDGNVLSFRHDPDASGAYATVAAYINLSLPTPGAGDDSNRLATTAFVQQELDTVSSAGELKLFARSTPPPSARVLVADGAAVSRTTYARLFDAIGTTYGVGNGSTTFNLPDWRGVFFRGLDNGRGLDANRQLGAQQASQNLSHTHSIPVGSAGSGTSGSFNGHASGDDYTSSVVGYSTSVASGGTEARPVNQALLACISY